MTENEFEDIFAIPRDIIFPDELSRYLKEQLAVFVRENASLQKNLYGSERKCAQLQEQVEALKNKPKEEANKILPSFASQTSQSINGKVVELSKNYRNKCAELEKYKTKCSKLVQQLEDMKIKGPYEEAQVVQAIIDEKLSEMKQLQEKLNATTSKMRELKNTNLQLNNELKQAQKLVQQEVGDNLASVQNNSGWKGRAQIICDLQEKNRVLKQKLKQMQEHAGIVAETRTINNERIGTKISNMEKENTDLKTQNETHKARIDSLKSRCGVLEVEHQELKNKIHHLKDRHDKDLELVASMSKQIGDAEHIKRHALKEKELEITKLNLVIQNNSSQIGQYKEVIDGLKLRRESKTQNVAINKDKNMTDACVQVPFEHQETENAKFLEMVNVYKKRLQKERNENEKYQQLLRVEKQRTTKLELAIARVELDSPATNRSRYSLISQSSRSTENNFKNQFELAEEHVKALQTRLELEQNERKRDFEEFSKILSSASLITNLDE